QSYLYLIKQPTDQYQVILEVQDTERASADDLGLLYIKSDDGKRMVPLRSLVHWRTTLGPQAVNHLNQFTSVTTFFNLKPGVAVGDATSFIEKAAAEVVPGTLRAGLQGEALTFRDTVRDLTILMLVAVFVMYVVLAVLYESYLHPLTVLSSLPVALAGGLFTLWLFREQATLYAYVGMFMLMGIVKKNGIMIVDFALQRIGRGAAAEDAIHDASLDRFRPSTTHAPAPRSSPSTPPKTVSITASPRNWTCTALSEAPTASRIPISRVRSVTETSITFITPMPPTTRAIDAMLINRTSSVWLV